MIAQVEILTSYLLILIKLTKTFIRSSQNDLLVDILCAFQHAMIRPCPYQDGQLLKLPVVTIPIVICSIKNIDKDGIRTHAPRGKWISSPSP